MKLIKFEISGFRNFYNKTTISRGDIESNFIALVGRNGSGKSTILEVIYWILGPSPIEQMALGYFSKGIHRETGAEFYLEIELAEDEKNNLLEQILAKDSYNSSLNQNSFNDYFNNKNTFNFLIKIEYDQNRGVDGREFKIIVRFNNNKEAVYIYSDYDLPSWFRVAKNNRLLCAYVGLIGGLSLNQQQILNLGQDIDTVSGFFSFNSDQRSSRVEVSLDSVIGNLTMKSIWDTASTSLSSGSKLSVDDDLMDLNNLIFPLQLDFDRSMLEKTGSLIFFITNNSQNGNIRYPISDVSAGERQMIILWAVLKNFQRSPLKPILLLDEPDNSLHPDYINRMGDLIIKSLGNAGSTCIMTTHSTELIAKVADNAYRIDAETHKIEKISDLSNRVKLFSELGRSIDSGFLVGRLVLVEGAMINYNDDEGLPDHEIYKKILDPTNKNFSFIPTGRKKDNVLAKNAVDNLVNISSIIGINDIIAIVDKDGYKNQPNNVKVLPVYCIENIFLQNKEILQDAIRQIINDDSFNIDNSGVLANKNIRTDSGKEVMKNLDSYLKNNYHAIYKKTGRIKEIQNLILNRATEDRKLVFGEELDNFFKEIENE